MKKRLIIMLIGLMALSGCGQNPSVSSQQESEQTTTVSTLDPSSESTTSETQSDESSSESSSEVPVSEESSEDPVSEESSENPVSEESSEEQPLKEFTTAKFTNKNVIYNGEPHTITVTGAPEGTNITYYNNGPFTNHGIYNMSAHLEKDGYIPKDLQATLTIEKNTYNVQFNDVTVEYDGNDHKEDIVVTGIIPAGTNISYVYRKDGSIVTELIDVGEYNVSANLSNPNFVDQTLTAKLTIKSEETEEYIATLGNKVYFSNALHRSYLYRYDASAEQKLMRLDYSTPNDFAPYGDKLLYTTSSVFTGSINTISSNDQIETLDSASARYIISSGDKVYYVKRGLTHNKSGIFVVDYSLGIESTACIYIGKVKYLELIGNKLYFADGRNSNKLSYVETTDSDKETATLLIDEKIKDLTSDGTTLAFTVNNVLGDYVAKLTPGTDVEAKKLTIDAGKNLQIVGSEVYYSNIDKITSAIFGKGIYKTPLNGSRKNLPGIQILSDAENDYPLSSLHVANNILYFYRVSNKHLYSFNLNTQELVDLMEGFVAPEEVPMSLGGKTVASGNTVYYQNIHSGKTLYSYNHTTGVNAKLTSNKVEDFALIGNDLFINQVSYLVNNDLYQGNVGSGSPASLISTDDARNMVRHGDYLFYVKHNAGGFATSICQLNLNDNSIIEFYSKGAKNLRIHNERIYFLDGGKIFYIPFSSIVTGMTPLDTAEQLGNIKYIDEFEIYQNYVFYIYKRFTTKEIRRTSINSFDEGTKIASKKTDPFSMVIYGNYVYYYSKAESAGTNSYGLYRVSVNATADETYQQVFKTYISSELEYYPTGISIANNRIYFLNYGLAGLSGDSHIYMINISGFSGTPVTNIVRID